MYEKITKCRVCGNSELAEVLDLGTQSLTGVFPKTKAQIVTAGPLRLVKCSGDQEACGLLQLQHTYDLNELYGQSYGYRSGLNAEMIAHLRRKVRRILERVALPEDALIIDIGANDGTTLKAYPKDGRTLVGIDPTGEKFREFYPKHVQLISEFFSAEVLRRHLGGRKASVITSFSMFYDLEQPLKFVFEIREALDSEGIWVFEQSYMPTMLRRNSYDTVCHEHLEYYGLKQVKWLLDRAGLKIVDVEFNDINGGSFSVTAACAASHHSESAKVGEILELEEREGLDKLATYREFARRVAENRASLREFLERSRRAGSSINGLGASTKGNVLLQYCGITESDIERIGEVNRDKFGSFTPGTLLPIVPEDEMLASNSEYLLVLPWHFRAYFEQSSKLSGRTLVFPLPNLELVRRSNSAGGSTVPH
jgi:NDP-4-keto-2,6-dideoxyhexose 3-C-methyltransferase